MKETYITHKNAVRSIENIFNNRNGSIINDNGVEIFLENRLKDFFTILVENKNDVVTREELMNFVWKDLVVSNESVTKAASDLRKFFATNNITDFKLITISKLGYKLEIIQPDLKKNNFVKNLFKTIGYLFLFLLLIILIIRAVNY